MKASDAVATFLLDRGITTGFGIIGSANSHLYDSFNKAGVRVINVHNEQAAVLAAGAFYRTCGQLSFALVTAGGGVTNAVTGVVSLWADSTPVLIFSGQEALRYLTAHAHRRMYGTQGLNIVNMVSGTTKYARTVTSGNTIQDELEKAYATALDGRKGPVWLDMPFDVQAERVEHRLWRPYVPAAFPPREADMAEVVKLLEASQRPVILCGHGVKLAGATSLFCGMLNHIRVPVLVTWSAISCVSHDHPLFFGSPGIYGQRAANFIFQTADFVLALGTRLTLPQTGYDTGELARQAKIVMVDVDTTEHKEFAHLCIAADCGEFLRKFQSNACVRPAWVETCAALRKEWPLVEAAHADGEFPNSYRMIDRISDALKADQIIVTDMGTALLSGHQAIRLREGHTMFTSYGLGEMGYGLPAALGAAFAGNGREVLCLNCDGGMMMNLQEMQTIIQHRLRVKIVIFNNDGYLMIKHTQNMLFNGDKVAVDHNTGIVLPDYVQLSKAFGYETFRVKSWSEFDFFFPRFMDFNGPAVCEIFMPTEQEFIPKVRGVLQVDGTIFAPPLEEMSPVLPLDVMQRVMGAGLSAKSLRIAR